MKPTETKLDFWQSEMKFKWNFLVNLKKTVIVLCSKEEIVNIGTPTLAILNFCKPHVFPLSLALRAILPFKNSIAAAKSEILSLPHHSAKQQFNGACHYHHTSIVGHPKNAVFHPSLSVPPILAPFCTIIKIVDKIHLLHGFISSPLIFMKNCFWKNDAIFPWKKAFENTWIFPPKLMPCCHWYTCWDKLDTNKPGGRE